MSWECDRAVTISKQLNIANKKRCLWTFDGRNFCELLKGKSCSLSFAIIVSLSPAKAIKTAEDDMGDGKTVESRCEYESSNAWKWKILSVVCFKRTRFSSSWFFEHHDCITNESRTELILFSSLNEEKCLRMWGEIVGGGREWNLLHFPCNLWAHEKKSYKCILWNRNIIALKKFLCHFRLPSPQTLKKGGKNGNKLNQSLRAHFPNRLSDMETFSWNPRTKISFSCQIIDYNYAPRL